jgi:hypothetical protein
MGWRQFAALALLLGAAQAFHYPHLYASSSVQALGSGLSIRRAASGGSHARLWASRRADTEGNDEVRKVTLERVSLCRRPL